MRIETNNGKFIEIERNNHGVSVASCDKNGHVERRDGFSDGEIVMVLNLLRYMRDNDHNSAFIICDGSAGHSEEINSGDMEEFRIFQ